jgi:hypothetical protein
MEFDAADYKYHAFDLLLVLDCLLSGGQEEFAMAVGKLTSES